MPDSNNTASTPQQPQPDYIYRPEDPEYSDQLRADSEVPSDPNHFASGLSQRYHHLSTNMDVNEVKTLTRMQILTPLSVLLQMGVMILCGSKLIKPNLQQVSRRHPTYLSVQDSFVLFYWVILYVLLIGFSVFLLLSRTSETKKALTHGVGTRLSLANYMMVLWAIFWILDRPLTFILGTATLGVIAVILLFNALVLAVRYPPSHKHPLDWLFIHVPIKMFLVITIQYDLWQQLFMALGWDFGSGGHDGLVRGLWPAFGIVSGLGVFSALWIFGTADLIWTAAGIYLNLGLLWHKHFSLIGGRDDGEPRPAPLTAAIILSIALQSVALIAGVAWKRIKARQEGRIALPLTPEEEAAAYRAEAERSARAAAATSSATLPATAPKNAVHDIADEEAAAESSGATVTPTKVTRKLGGGSSNASPTKKK
ncbi:uncharacterized protein UMAG_01792 [Mycosarcoma maydis]|uniref:Uncharacterized protein n=1 Tax=Mycosarcoma maydis TaxID=5270 RepID=A0A0D1CBN8_MYCMD|nr:uncharacterized protein UMAG_01792 [Ustilago maydis 521]KIS70627.1 hypothetical protein UMAG_01792 [Ustilago maydis 521]|eukprot:XP_011387747.1 hypothetical protein UMAG_01792 [Ustilago maydis 521]